MKPSKSITGRSDLWATCLAVGVALLPRLSCPCQFPAYAGLMGSMGLAFLLQTVYLFPITAMCLTLAVGGLALRAKRRWGYGPFWLGLLAAVTLMIAKFVVSAETVVHGSIVLLWTASVWNAWPRAQRKLRFNPDGSLAMATPRRRRSQSDSSLKA